MSIERTFINYISQILNIKLENDFVLEDIRTELKEISNLNKNALIEFRTFIKENLKHIDLNYLTGFQKFIKLSEMFKNICRASISRGINKKAYTLGLKLRRVFNPMTRDNLLNPLFKFSYIKTKEGCFFTTKELYILEQLEKKKLFGLVLDPYSLEQELLRVYQVEARKLFQIKINPAGQLENDTKIVKKISIKPNRISKKAF